MASAELKIRIPAALFNVLHELNVFGIKALSYLADPSMTHGMAGVDAQ
jgi:hypothetical protein